MVQRSFLVAAAGALALAGATAAPAQAKTDMFIGGGSVTGIYYQVALQSCAIINKYRSDDYNCVGRPALGSVFNVNAVNRGLLDFGVAQSDRNFQAHNGAAEWEGKPVAALRSVFSVHPEAVLLVTRADTGITDVAGLKGKTVNIGNPGSGQRGNALDILSLYGIDPDSDIRAEGLQQTEASRALIDGKVDAFFYTVGLPNSAIEEPANSVDLRFVDINSAAVAEFISDKPFYAMAMYPAGVVKGSNAFETFGVKATVVTNEASDATMVYDYVKTLFENLEEFKTLHAAFANLAPAEMTEGLTAPLHPGAARYFAEAGLD